MPEEEDPLGRSLSTPHKGHYIEYPLPPPTPGTKLNCILESMRSSSPFFSDKGTCDETTQLNKLASPIFFCKALNNVFQGCGPEFIVVFSYEYTIFLVPPKT